MPVDECKLVLDIVQVLTAACSSVWDVQTRRYCALPFGLPGFASL